MSYVLPKNIPPHIYLECYKYEQSKYYKLEKYDYKVVRNTPTQ